MVPLVFQNLVYQTPEGKYYAGMAKAWEFKDNGRTIVFQISEDKSNRSPLVSSHEIALSISSHFWKSSKSIMKGFLASVIEDGTSSIPDGTIIKAIKIISDRELSFKLKTSNSNILQALSLPGFAIMPNLKKIDFKNPVGTGPMVGRYSEVEKSWIFQSKDKYGGGNKFTIVVKEIGQNPTNGKINLEDLDVIIDVPYFDPSLIENQNAFRRTDFQSFQFSHLFFNLTRGTYFSDRQIRKILKDTIQTIRDEFGGGGEAFAPLNSYLPFGVMPSSYYENDERAKMPTTSEIDRLKRNIKGHAIRIILVADYLPRLFPSVLSTKLKEMKLNIEVKTIRKFELSEAVRKGEFDLISISYLGTAASPQTFLTPLLDESNFNILKLPPNQSNLVRKFIIHSESPNNVEFITSLKSFERRYFVVPLYHIRPSILTHERIEFEYNKYKFESDLTSFHWKTGTGI
jgi:ABC-type oligopeptide transport system substrate-binding subunit